MTQTLAPLKNHNTYIDYAGTKAKAIKNQPLIVKMPLSSFELGRNRTIKIDGKIMPTTDRAYDKFLTRILGVSPGFTDNFRNNTDAKTEVSMLQVLKSGIAAKRHTKVNIIADPAKLVINTFSTEDEPVISNEKFFDLFEMIMNRYNDLKLMDMYVDGTGALALNARGTEEVVLSRRSNDEFLGGFNFANKPGEYASIGEQLLRIICKNGMVNRSRMISSLLLTNDKDQVDKLFEHLDMLQSKKFISPAFQFQYERVDNTTASVSELNTAMKMMKSHSKIDESTARGLLGYSDVSKYLANRAIDMESLSGGQMKNCPTNLKVWDIVNVLTHFGSHDLGFNVNAQEMQRAAGKFFNKKQFDEKNFISLN